MEGNAFNREDLSRCLTIDSDCVIILANKMSKDPIKEDYKNILRLMAVKQYSKRENKPVPRVCI